MRHPWVDHRLTADSRHHRRQVQRLRRHQARQVEVVIRPPGHYLRRGPDGDEVVIPRPIVASIDRHAHLSRLRAIHRGADRETDNALIALRIAALSYNGSARGTEPTSDAPPETPLRQWFSTADVAGEVGITERGVRTAMAKAWLNAQKLSGGWIVTRQALEDYTAARRDS
jgi:hypothetical protein